MELGPYTVWVRNLCFRTVSTKICRLRFQDGWWVIGLRMSEVWFGPLDVSVSPG